MIPPQNLEAEQAVLGCVLIDGTKAMDQAIGLVSETDFYREAHRMLWQTCLRLHEQTRPIELLTVEDDLRTRGLYEEVGGHIYLLNLMEVPSVTAHLPEYCQIVVEKSLLRALLDCCQQAQQEVQSDKSPKAILEEVQQRILSLTSPTDKSFHALPPLVEESLDGAEYRTLHRGERTGLMTGFADFDYVTGGLEAGDLIILAARPAMGKSAIVMQMAYHVAQEQQQPVAVFSLEMSKEQLVNRIVCSEARVDAHRYKTGYLTEEDWRQLEARRERLTHTPLFIHDQTEQTALQMQSRCRQLAAQHGPIALIVIDYLQIIHMEDKFNRSQEIGAVCRTVRQMGREQGCPVILLSQLSRQVENRPDKRPLLSDLRESGSIEAEADMVCFLYRDAYYHPDEPQGEIEVAELIVAKNRKGRVAKVEIGFTPELVRFDTLASDREAAEDPYAEAPEGPR